MSNKLYGFYKVKQEYKQVIGNMIDNAKGQILSIPKIELELSRKYPFGKSMLLKELQLYKTAKIIDIDEIKNEVIVYDKRD